MMRSITETHVVNACRVVRFASAIGAPRTDVAPPTFPIVFIIAAQERMLADPALDFDYSRVVHREQHFSYRRAIRAGDVLTVTIGLESIETLNGNAIANFQVTIRDGEELVCTSRAVLVSRALVPA